MDGEKHISPANGHELIKGTDGLYGNPYEDTKYLVFDDGRIKPLKDPYSGSDLTFNSDGTLKSTHTGENFTYEPATERIIPLYVPDDTIEPAHIENGKLVGNETGRIFEIDDKGMILTPQEIEFQGIKQEETNRFEEMEKDGTIEQYLDEIEQKGKEGKPLTKEDIENILKQDNLDIEQLKEIKDKIQTGSMSQVLDPNTQSAIEQMDQNPELGSRTM